jgi:hypothetical protein
MWNLSSSSDPLALSVVDGTGKFKEFGPHYSRRTPGSKTFTGVGREVVLISEDESAVWAVVYQKTPSKRGSGRSRGRSGRTDLSCRYLWRNMLFRNLGRTLSSLLIEAAVEKTYVEWVKKYECLPEERLRTEVSLSVKSQNPGYCYMCAGWEKGETVRGKRYFYAPPRSTF